MHKVLKVVSSINVRVSALLLFLLISIGGAGFFQKNQLTESDNSIQSQQALLEYLGLVTQIS